MASRRSAFTLIELLVVISIIAVLIGLLLPAVQKVREASSRTECGNNLHQLGVAILTYKQQYGGYPAAHYSPPSGTSHNWVALILPYIDQGNLQKQYSFDVAWDNAANDNGVLQTRLKVLLCPSAPVTFEDKLGHHAANGPGGYRATLDYPAITDALPRLLNGVTDSTYPGVLGNQVSRKDSEITDGASNTLMLAEDAGRNQHWAMGKPTTDPISHAEHVGFDGSWGNPDGRITISGYDPATNQYGVGTCAVNCANDRQVYSFHPGLAGGLFADGHVTFLKSSTPINILVGLMTRAGGEQISDSQY